MLSVFIDLDKYGFCHTQQYIELYAIFDQIKWAFHQINSFVISPYKEGSY